MARQSALFIILSALTMLLASLQQPVTAISTGRSLTDTAAAPAPGPMDELDSAEDIAGETGEELEEVGDDIDSGVGTAVDEVDEAGEEAVDEIDEAFTDAAGREVSTVAAVVAAAVAGLFMGV